MSVKERLNALFTEETDEEKELRKVKAKEDEEELLEKIKQSTKELHNSAYNNTVISDVNLYKKLE